MVRTALEAADGRRRPRASSSRSSTCASLSPLDLDTLAASVRRTGRLVVVHEAPTFLGMGAEIAARITERCFYHLEAPVLRVGGFDTPYPPSRYEMRLEFECHFPPGTSKWNKIEHRLFCLITKNSHRDPDQLRGDRQPHRQDDLEDRADGAGGPGHHGLPDRAEGQRRATGQGPMHPGGFHGEWNYIIHPRA